MDAINRRQLRPFDHPALMRLGLPRDGGYVVPEPEVRSAAVLLSLGIKQDWSFDRAFAAANPRVRVIGVDPGIGPLLFLRQIAVSAVHIVRTGIIGNARQARRWSAVLRNSIDYFRFFAPPNYHIRKKVAAGDSDATISLATLLSLAGAGTDDRRVFLKMDVDGAEYDLIPTIVNSSDCISCLVGEFHGLSRNPPRFNQAVTQLLEHFRIVHIHGNNYGPYDKQQDFPTAVEITFVNRRLLDGSSTLSTREYPRTDLDYPNAPGRPDHTLRFEL